MSGEGFDGRVLPLGGGTVLVGPRAVPTLVRALRAAERAARRDGIQAPPEFVELRDVLAAVEVEARSAARQSAAVPMLSQVGDGGSCSGQFIGTAEAAKVLGCQPRNVRDLIARRRLRSARYLLGKWVVDSAEVAARAAGHGARRGVE